jgi:hypothetical protein
MHTRTHDPNTADMIVGYGYGCGIAYMYICMYMSPGYLDGEGKSDATRCDAMPCDAMLCYAVLGTE